MLRELPLDVGDTPNYYCLVLRADEAAAPGIAFALTRCGLGPDTIRWRYQGLHHRPMFARWASPCPLSPACSGSSSYAPEGPSIATGSPLTSSPHRISGHRAPEDLLGHDQGV